MTFPKPHFGPTALVSAFSEARASRLSSLKQRAHQDVRAQNRSLHSATKRRFIQDQFLRNSGWRPSTAATEPKASSLAPKSEPAIPCSTRASGSLGQFEERIEAHVIVGIGALTFVLQKMLPLFAVHLLQKTLRAAEQAEPLQRKLAVGIRAGLGTEAGHLVRLETAEQLVLERQEELK